MIIEHDTIWTKSKERRWPSYPIGDKWTTNEMRTGEWGSSQAESWATQRAALAPGHLKETPQGDTSRRHLKKTPQGDTSRRHLTETPEGDTWRRHLKETPQGDTSRRHLKETPEEGSAVNPGLLEPPHSGPVSPAPPPPHGPASPPPATRFISTTTSKSAFHHTCFRYLQCWATSHNKHTIRPSSCQTNVPIKNNNFNPNQQVCKHLHFQCRVTGLVFLHQDRSAPDSGIPYWVKVQRLRSGIISDTCLPLSLCQAASVCRVWLRVLAQPALTWQTCSGQICTGELPLGRPYIPMYSLTKPFFRSSSWYTYIYCIYRFYYGHTCP